ncbi:MAG: sigma-70 family RNA polymerase sigma factor [Deltaproteobacteria bacterium]|nr:sigma-70 family RNA polymerase sigma factor [Deltaproteobacteria bacterium]
MSVICSIIPYSSVCAVTTAIGLCPDAIRLQALVPLNDERTARALVLRTMEELERQEGDSKDEPLVSEDDESEKGLQKGFPENKKKKKNKEEKLKDPIKSYLEKAPPLLSSEEEDRIVQQLQKLKAELIAPLGGFNANLPPDTVARVIIAFEQASQRSEREIQELDAQLTRDLREAKDSMQEEAIQSYYVSAKREAMVDPVAVAESLSGYKRERSDGKISQEAVIKIIGTYQLLLKHGNVNREEIARTVRKFEEARNVLVAGNLRLVVTIGGRFRSRWMNLDDCIGEGNIGLIYAAETYDPSVGLFSTWAGRCIENEIKHASRSRRWKLIYFPSHYIAVGATHDRLVHRLRGELGRSPTINEVCAELQITDEKKRKQYVRMITAYKLFRSVPAINRVDREGNKPSVLYVQADNRQVRPVHEVQTKEEILVMMQRLDALPDDWRTILYKYYAEGKTLDDIGKECDPPVTRERVRQIKEKAEKKLFVAVYAAEVAELQKSLRRSPDVEEVLDAWTVPFDQRNGFQQSIEEAYTEKKASGHLHWNPIQFAETPGDQLLVRVALRTFDEMEQRILTEYYEKGLTADQIAQGFEPIMTDSSVWKIKTTADKKLFRRLYEAKVIQLGRLFGREPTFEEVCDSLKIPPAEREKRSKMLNGSQ